MDEIEFVRFLKQRFPFDRGQGIGDDASVVRINDTFQLITTDILIEDIHFKRTYFSITELAERSLAVNLSDIAAMGGKPCYYYLGLACPKEITNTELLSFFSALAYANEKWQIQLAGGDFSRSSILCISITMVGESKAPVYRHGAQNGDLIGITGNPGESDLGLRLLQKGKRRGYFINQHKHVLPRIDVGLILSRYVNAMIDVSDGLLFDLKRILLASDKGADISYEKIPVSPRFKEVCRKNGWNEHHIVLSGGEDYQLLFTLSPENEMKLKKEGIGYSVIGKIHQQDREIWVKEKSKILDLTKLGYDHFSASDRETTY